MMAYIRDLIYSATISSTSPGVKVACFTASFVWTEMLAACSWARILIAVRATVRETPHRSDAMPVRGATHLHSDREAGRVVPGVALRTHEHAQGHLGLNGRDLHRQAHWVQGPSEAYINQIVGSEEPPLVFPANYTGSHLMRVYACTSENILCILGCRLHVRRKERVHDSVKWGSADQERIFLAMHTGSLPGHHSHSLGRPLLLVERCRGAHLHRLAIDRDDLEGFGDAPEGDVHPRVGHHRTQTLLGRHRFLFPVLELITFWRGALQQRTVRLPALACACHSCLAGRQAAPASSAEGLIALL